MILEALNVGDFRTRLSLQTPVRIRSTDGGYTTGWAEIRKVWASFIPLDNPTRPARSTWSSEGSEKPFSGQLWSQQKHVIFIRAQPENVQTDWRLVKLGNDNRVYNINEVLLIANVRKMIRIIARENVSQPDDATAAYTIMVDDNNNPMLDDNGGYIVYEG